MLYTKRGDKGDTKFLDTKKGARVSKSSLRAEALGFLDELNSFLGLCKARALDDTNEVKAQGQKISAILERVQENLFIVQAGLAGAKKKIIKSKVVAMEKTIDSIEKEIPLITGFSLAGGVELSALLDVARTIARRTERAMVAVCEVGEGKLSADTRAYVNHLSSLLFALARLVNHKAGVKVRNPNYK